MCTVCNVQVVSAHEPGRADRAQPLRRVHILSAARPAALPLLGRAASAARLPAAAHTGTRCLIHYWLLYPFQYVLNDKTTL